MAKLADLIPGSPKKKMAEAFKAKFEPAGEFVRFELMIPLEAAILIPGLIAAATGDADLKRIIEADEVQIAFKQLSHAILGKHSDADGNPLPAP